MDITVLRQKIDCIDDEITRLFSDRMDTVLEIAKYKKDARMGVLDSGREREIISRVTDIAGPAYAVYAKILFTTLFNLSRSYQNQMLSPKTPLCIEIEKVSNEVARPFPTKAVVACQGVEGAYSQQACDKLFSIPDIMYFSRFEGVFQAVESGLCRYGILPIENSAVGSVTAVYDLMKKYHFYIVRSIRLKIDHSLLTKPGTTLENIKEIVSHEQGLGQCSDFFKQHPGIKATVFENTAAAARFVAESGRSDLAAIASPNCASLYHLSQLPVSVQNTDHNYTRFICISKNLEIYPGANKISLLLSVAHKPGSIYSLVAKFASLGINLTKLESRPIPGKDFEFMFYFDIEASIYSPETVSLMAELEYEQDFFAFLGSYSEIA
jgi:chorismate mutase/prephenate dehydratase